MANTNLKTADPASGWRAAIAVDQETIFDYLLDNIYAIVIIAVALLSFVLYGIHRCYRRLRRRRNNKIHDEQQGSSKDKKSATVALKKGLRRDYILDHLRTRKMKRTSLNMIGGGGGGDDGGDIGGLSTNSGPDPGKGDTQRKIRQSSLILQLDKEATSDEPSLSLQSSLDDDIISFDSKPFEIGNRSESITEGSNGGGILRSLGTFATSLFTKRRHHDGDDDGSDESGRKVTRCHICLCDFDVGEDICYSRNNLCRHTFHKECIVEWLMDHDRCPCCHRDFQLSSSDDTTMGVGSATTTTKESGGRSGGLTVTQDSVTDDGGDEGSVDSEGAVRPAVKVSMRNDKEQIRRSSLVDVGF